jgi:hypothetical protein
MKAVAVLSEERLWICVLSKVVLNFINICIIINSLKTSMICKLDKKYCKFYVNEAIAQWKSQTSTVRFSYWWTNCVLSDTFKFSTSIEVWLGNYLKFTNLPSNVYFLLTMIAFSCALYNTNHWQTLCEILGARA